MLFKILDKNGDGLISMEEMLNCGQKLNSKDIDAIFAVGDVNNDGEIDMSEFVGVLCPSASTVVARISKEFKTINDIKEVFQKLDKDNDGNISKQELRVAGYNDQEINAIFALGDSNNDGQIDLEEFIAVMCPSAAAVVNKISKMFTCKDTAIQTFKKIDINNDGKISKEEMRGATLQNGTRLHSIEVDAIFALGDANKDGEIDVEEFLSVMMPSAGFSQSFSSSSNTKFIQTSSMQQSFSSAQSYQSTTTYSSTTVSVSFSNAGEVKKAFRSFDTNGDGHLDR